jgi:hypothetical protein
VTDRPLHPFAYATYPRQLNRALRGGKLSADEFLILVALYARANRQAWTVSTTLEQIAEAIAWSHSHDWLRKRLVALRKKRCIEYETRPGRRQHIYRIRLLYDGPKVSEESLRSQRLNDAGLRSDRPPTRLSRHLESLSTGNGANPLPEPDSEPASVEAVGASRDVLEKTTTLSEDQNLGEGSPRLEVHYEGEQVEQEQEPEDEPSPATVALDRFRETVESARERRLAELREIGAREPAGEEAILAEVEELIGAGVLIEEP